jgi:hypothetical protein
VESIHFGQKINGLNANPALKTPLPPTACTAPYLYALQPEIILMKNMLRARISDQ